MLKSLIYGILAYSQLYVYTFSPQYIYFHFKAHKSSFDTSRQLTSRPSASSLLEEFHSNDNISIKDRHILLSKTQPQTQSNADSISLKNYNHRQLHRQRLQNLQQLHRPTNDISNLQGHDISLENDNETITQVLDSRNSYHHSKIDSNSNIFHIEYNEKERKIDKGTNLDRELSNSSILYHVMDSASADGDNDSKVPINNQSDFSSSQPGSSHRGDRDGSGSTDGGLGGDGNHAYGNDNDKKNDDHSDDDEDDSDDTKESDVAQKKRRKRKNKRRKPLHRVSCACAERLDTSLIDIVLDIDVDELFEKIFGDYPEGSSVAVAAHTKRESENLKISKWEEKGTGRLMRKLDYSGAVRLPVGN